jgi:hypothetical protein
LPQKDFFFLLSGKIMPACVLTKRQDIPHLCLSQDP